MEKEKLSVKWTYAFVSLNQFKNNNIKKYFIKQLFWNTSLWKEIIHKK